MLQLRGRRARGRPAAQLTRRRAGGRGLKAKSALRLTGVRSDELIFIPIKSRSCCFLLTFLPHKRSAHEELCIQRRCLWCLTPQTP